MFKKLFTAIWEYLKDWKNLLAHSVIGLGILGIALFLPVSLPVRIVILVGVVSLNILRMRLEKKKSAVTELSDKTR